MKNLARLAGALGGVLTFLVGVSCIAAALKLRQDVQDRRIQDQVELEREREEYRRDAMAAFNDPVPPSPEEAALFQSVLDKLGKALDRQNENEIGRHFDTERFVQELVRQGLFEKIPGGATRLNRNAFIEGMNKGGGFGAKPGEQHAVPLVGDEGPARALESRPLRSRGDRRPQVE